MKKATETDLPRRPRLLPGLEVLQRSADEVQIGLDPRHGVVAYGLSPRLMTALHLLDGSHTTSALLALAEGDEVEALRDVLTNLTARGLVEEAGPPATPAGSRGETGLWSLRTGQARRDTAALRAHCAVSVRGDGRLTVALATLLAASGLGHVEVQAAGNVTTGDLGSGYTDADVGSAKRTAAAAAINRANPATRTTKLFGRSPDLVLLTDTVVPAPELVRELMYDGQPHLLVRVRDGIGIVGPLVVPGRTSCLRCADLHRTARDSCWPRVASQLAGRAQHADLGSVQATVALATCQALRVLQPGDQAPPVWNATLEIDSYAGTVWHRHWPPHPLCDCGTR
jgi:hypothetical protein